jgi:hypothetical protein
MEMELCVLVKQHGEVVAVLLHGARRLAVVAVCVAHDLLERQHVEAKDPQVVTGDVEAGEGAVQLTQRLRDLDRSLVEPELTSTRMRVIIIDDLQASKQASTRGRRCTARS